MQRTTVLAGRKRKLFAHAGLASPRHNVVLELGAEVAQRGQHRIRRRLSQAAQRALAYVTAQLIKQLQVMHRARAFGHAIQNPQGLIQSHPARNAFAARLGMRELDEVSLHVHHAVVFVHHNHAARSHDRAQLRQAFVVHRGIEHLVRNASARGAAGLHRLDLAPTDAAFADVINKRLERRAQRHLDQAGARNFAHQ